MRKIGRPREIGPDQGQGIADKIKQLRRKLSCSQKEIGAMIGVTSQSIGGWERGARLPYGDHYDSLISLLKKQFQMVEIDMEEEKKKRGTYVPEEKILYDFDFAESIKAVRKKNEWTQKKLGDMIGVNKNTIYKWEQLLANPTGINMLRLKEIIGRYL